MKPITGWAGVVDWGKGPRLNAEFFTDSYGAAVRLEVFVSRSSARARYQKVIPVEIREVPKRKKGKP